MKTSAQQIAAIGPVDLRHEAQSAVDRGESVSIYVEQRSDADYSGPVTTVVVGDRAAQCTNGDAVWGDWRAESMTVAIDDGAVVGLDGRECHVERA